MSAQTRGASKQLRMRESVDRPRNRSFFGVCHAQRVLETDRHGPHQLASSTFAVSIESALAHLAANDDIVATVT